MASPRKVSADSCRPVEAKFDTTDGAVTINPGDLLIQSAGLVSPIGSGTVTTAFIGVAAQKKEAGTTGKAIRLYGNSTDGVIRVDTDGVFDFDCADTIALVPGDPVGPGGNSYTVAKVGNESIAVGRVVKHMAANAGRVRVKIQSNVIPAANKGS
jgi:hypothetical protein